MGRGNGGYVEKQDFYRDTAGRKVIDKGAIAVAEAYIDQGKEVVFRRVHEPDQFYDLTIKDPETEEYIKDIEVKTFYSFKANTISAKIENATSQLASSKNPVITLYLPTVTNEIEARCKLHDGIIAAMKHIQSDVEVLMGDKTFFNLISYKDGEIIGPY